MKTTCETEGCENAVRRHQRHCDDCIVAEARRRKREREETESGIRGGQGRSGADVEQSAVIGGAALVGAALLVFALLVLHAVMGASGGDAGRVARSERSMRQEAAGRTASGE